MTHTLETILQAQLGQLMMQLASLLAENAALKEQLATLAAAHTGQKPDSGGSPG